MQRPAPEGVTSALSGTIPESLQYGVESSPGVDAVRSLRNYAAENPGIFSPANNVIRIPIHSNNFLDLKNGRIAFDMSTTAADTVTVVPDGGAQCVIRRLRVLGVDGAELERLEEYGLLASVLDQYQRTQEEMIADGIFKGSATQTIYGTAAPYLGLELGLDPGFFTGLKSVTATLSPSRHYEFQLKAGWLNPTLGKLLPPDMPFVLELTLDEIVRAFHGAASAYAVSNVYFKVPTVRVNDQAFMDRVGMLKSRGSEWSATTYKLHTSTLGQGTGSGVVQISDRSHSLKALIACFRLQTSVSSATHFGLSKRSIQYITDYQAQIGSDLYPPTQVKIAIPAAIAGGSAEGTTVADSGQYGLNISDAFAEAKRVFGHNGVITAENFAGSENGRGCGVAAIDCQAYHSDKRTTSGLDTASQATPVTLNVTKGVAANGTLQVDVFAMADISFMALPGGGLRSMS
jgi:hypothetical protein